MEIIIQNDDLDNLAKNAKDLPEEVLGVSIEQLSQAISVLVEYKRTFEYNLIKKMEDDQATKMKFQNHSGAMKTATLVKGSMNAVKDAFDLYKQSGFDPGEIGDMVFKPKWSKAKEAAKLGRAKSDIINKIFYEGKKFIKIVESL